MHMWLLIFIFMPLLVSLARLLLPPSGEGPAKLGGLWFGVGLVMLPRGRGTLLTCE